VPPQLLVNILPVSNLASGASTTLAHGLASSGVSVPPTLVFPDRATPIVVVGVTATEVTFRNGGLVAETANFRCERGWQPEVDAFTVSPMLWQGSGGAGNGGAGNGGSTSTYLASTQPSVGGGWSDYEEFEAAAVGSSANLIGSTTVSLRNAPSSLPQQHLVVRNGRIMRVNRDYTLAQNEIVLARVLTEGDVLVVYYNRVVV
jgi:hypothetical protein